MTYEEIRSSLQSLTKQEREELALDLKMLALLDDPDYMAEMARRREEMEAGKYITSEELHRIIAARGQDAA